MIASVDPKFDVAQTAGISSYLEQHLTQLRQFLLGNCSHAALRERRHCARIG
jgi:hypothetical protein